MPKVSALLQWEFNVRDVKSQLVAALAQIAPGEVHKAVERYIAINENNPAHILNCFQGT